MFHVECLDSTQTQTTELYSKFRLEPLAKGQGLTVGTALRRTLLSSLLGTSIIGVRIASINHEFSTVPGITEDVIEILLNLKQIVFKGYCAEVRVARLSFQGPGIITAGNIELENGLTVVNSKQYIATVETPTNIEMEFLLSTSKGYSLDSMRSIAIPRGFLAVDAVFMPARKVNFFVEVSHEPKIPDFESVILEIQTDGSITPTEALNDAALILQNCFGSIVTNDSPIASSITENNDSDETQTFINNTLIEELELSVRAYNCLKRADITTLSDLLKYKKKDLLELKNFGQKSANEVCEILDKRFNINLN